MFPSKPQNSVWTMPQATIYFLSSKFYIFKIIQPCEIKNQSHYQTKIFNIFIEIPTLTFANSKQGCVINRHAHSTTNFVKHPSAQASSVQWSIIFHISYLHSWLRYLSIKWEKYVLNSVFKPNLLQQIVFTT